MRGGDFSLWGDLDRIFGDFPEALIGLAALGILTAAAYQISRSLRLVRGARQSGVIVDWIVRSDSESADSYAPLFEFTPQGAAGKIRVQSQNGWRSSPGEKGEIVVVTYDPVNPRRAEIAGFGRQFLGISMTLILGFAALYVAWSIGGS